MKMPVLTLKRGMRLTFWQGVFALILAAGLYSTYVRFFHGLGAVANMNDTFPWGIWVSFDILCGVGLAAGGFTMAAVTHIFHIKKFEPIIRPAILTAFLGYLLVIFGLMYDLGQPWDIWHPMVMWNPSSVMFEVSWCVMLYTTVLALEFSPVVFEKFRMEKPLRIIRNITVPLVILGVMFSTLHQSSLGAMFLIAKEKMYPLFYSPMLPLNFFVSSVAVGFAMVIFESYLSARAFKKQLETPLLMDLARIVVFMLALVLVLRLQDLGRSGSWDLLFLNRPETYFFWGELLIGVMIPMVLLAFRKVRMNEFALFSSVVMVILGFIANRFNVAMISMESHLGGFYVPSWMELSITIMIVALGFFAFRQVVKHFHIFHEPEMPEVPYRKPIPVVVMKHRTGISPKAATEASHGNLRHA